MLELVIISTLNGVLYGMLLFLMASGLTLIFSMMGVLNFAHASFYMLGAFFGFQISQWLGFWPAFVVAPVLVFGVGTGLAAVAAFIAGPAFVTQSNMPAVLGPILFIVIVVGGLGSLSGAFVASLLIGLVQTFAVSVNYSASDLFAGIGFSPASGTILHDLWEGTLAQIAPIIPYLILVLILIFRPTGLLGKRET